MSHRGESYLRNTLIRLFAIQKHSENKYRMTGNITTGLAARDTARAFGLDRYDLLARLRPALLVSLPLILVAVGWFSETRTLMGGLFSLLSVCGVTYLLAQVARSRGRALESRAGPRLGRLHTATLLSHADGTIVPDTKARYHAFIRAGGVQLPSLDEEAKDQAGAAQRYRSAVDWLLERTRSSAKTSLLLEENIAYGFRRNLLGLKPIALGMLALALGANGYLTYDAYVAGRPLILGAVIGAGLALLLIAWLVLVNEAFVRDASDAYAKRLLAMCDRLADPAPAPPKRPRKPSTAKPTA